ncbi:hypothetical protein Salat_0641500 [Sesamum alatum]|uniref:Uncharacterized protein n=1 Tax=Sesamum alatum TaxID=300844 RepID=A0AAE1YR86_9LAMI|nr:hypothetical protein Salat_0641500 [Sesamum alatum]
MAALLIWMMKKITSEVTPAAAEATHAVIDSSRYDYDLEAAAVSSRYNFREAARSHYDNHTMGSSYNYEEDQRSALAQSPASALPPVHLRPQGTYKTFCWNNQVW